MRLVTEKNAAEIDRRMVAIVQFGPPTESDGLRPAQFYQVTIDPKRFSRCGEFIRFGSYPGDELVGWQRAKCIYVISELAVWPEDVEKLEIQWWESPALEDSE